MRSIIRAVRRAIRLAFTDTICEREPGCLGICRCDTVTYIGADGNRVTVSDCHPTASLTVADSDAGPYWGASNL